MDSSFFVNQTDKKHNIRNFVLYSFPHYFGMIPGRNCWGMVQDCSHPKLNVFQKDILQVHTYPFISAFFVNKLSKFLQLEV